METSRGVVKVTITSAEPLKKKTLESIQSAVVSMAGAGKTVSYFCNKYIIVFLWYICQVQIETKEDPSILGGLQILVGDKFLDLSVSSRIAEVTATLESSEL